MTQSLAKIAVHLVYSTKHRMPWLQDKVVRPDLYAYAATVLRDEVDSPAITINGTADHIHLLFLLSKKAALMDVVKASKTETTKWIKRQVWAPPEFAWQAGYAAFSVSESMIPRVKKYIDNQEEHHRRMSFQDELRQLCVKHNVALDERYAWD